MAAHRLNRAVIKGSLILIIGFGIYNFLHFLFHFFMVRFLSVSDYSILASVFVVVYISSVFSESIQNFIVKYASQEKDSGKLKNILARISRKIAYVGAIVIILYLISAIYLAKLLSISYWLLALGGIILAFAFVIPITRGVLQGKKKFTGLSLNMISEAITKLIVGTLLVMFGVGVFGAIVGVIAASLTGLLISCFQLREIIYSKEERAEISGAYAYAKPTFFLTATIVIFYSIDVWIARIFFTPEISGAYAIASLLGKILFWGTLPISKAMLPLSSDTTKQPGSGHVFRTSLILLVGGIVAVLIAFYLFPEEIIKIFSGKIVPDAANILFAEGLAFSLIAIVNLVILYKLSVNALQRYYYAGLFLVIEIILLSIFSKNLIQFSWAFCGASLAFLIYTLFFLRRQQV